MISDVIETFQTENTRAEISMAPLIDMVFILLIFFVVTTTFVKATGIHVDKARASTTTTIHKKLFVVAIDKDGSYWHDNAKYTCAEIVELAADAVRQSEGITVMVIPDRDGRIQPLITILDRLKANEITNFTLGTEKAESDTTA